jgi:DNA-binding transcriptional MerR regulator
MGLQQLGFDFFDAAPPEEKIPAKESLRKKVEEVEKVQKIQEVVEEQILVEETPAVLIVVDETPRDVEFIASKPEVKPATTKNPGKKSTRGRMKLADMDVMVDLVEVPEDSILFQKRYYGIGEVSDMFKVNISLIRFWENEFDILKPKKNGKGDRLFRPEDIKSLQLIYHLLREKKYTIDGAKDFLKKNKKTEEAFAMIETLKKTKAFLLDLKANL